MTDFGDCSDREIPELCPGLPCQQQQLLTGMERLDQKQGMGIAEELDPGEGGVRILDHLPLSGGMKMRIECIDQNETFRSLKRIGAERGMQAGRFRGRVAHPCQQGTLAIAAVAEALLITIGEALHHFARTGVETPLFPGPAGVPGHRRAPPSAWLESLVSGS